ncbi:MAG: hypothetical protein K6E33_02720 [Lachnospiraceae bacterium]|nr:hypothetical protein [Lachnospiraceae bacterium]
MENDFKYIIQDFDGVYIGAKYTFDELVNGEDVPPKLQGIVYRHLMGELEPETTLESQLYYLTSEDPAFKAYKRLRAKVKYTQKRKNDDSRLDSRDMKIAKFVEIPIDRKKELGIVIRELEISKLGLMSFGV